MVLSLFSDAFIPFYKESDLEQLFTDINLNIICKKSDSFASSIYLLRKPIGTAYKDTVIPILPNEYGQWVPQLRDHLVKAQTSAENNRLWLVSEKVEFSGIIGLVNCLRKEPGGTSIRCVWIKKEKRIIPDFSLENSFYDDILKKDLVMNINKHGNWGSYRHVLIDDANKKVETSRACLKISTPGDLSSLVWIESPLKYYTNQENENSLLVHIYYSALNFRDVMLASGKLNPGSVPDLILGREFSGRMETGHRVMGIVPSRGLATTVMADPHFLWDVPDHWTLEEASTVPFAYSMAYYALIVKGNLKKGGRILIHSGSSAVGQAAIAISFSMGCEVFTSVDSLEKKTFLLEHFPQLKEDNFCDSRDMSLESHILNATKGEGVDLVLNSLSNDKIEASLDCLGEDGCFLEIEMHDDCKDTLLGTSRFLKNFTHHVIHFESLFNDTNAKISSKTKVFQLVNDGITNGIVKPLVSTLFESDQAEQAFRYMANGHNIGKVVLKIKEEEQEKKAIVLPTKMMVLAYTLCKPEKTYIIIGGLGGMGLELCQWLIDRGAKNIVLTSKSEIKNGYQKLCLERWQEYNVVVSRMNVAKCEEAKLLLENALSHGPIGGIFHLATVLRNALMENQTPEMFQEVCEPKVASTHNLDKLSRMLCPQLDWFVCFSSVSCGRGNAGQSNYGYANSAMEKICEERKNDGLPALVIQWGMIEDVAKAYVIDGKDENIMAQHLSSCLSVLDKFLQQNNPVVSSFVPYSSPENGPEKTSSHKVLLKIGKIFGIRDTSVIKPEMTFGELGMDSLIGVEVKDLLEKEFDMDLDISEIGQLKVKDIVDFERKSLLALQTNIY